MVEINKLAKYENSYINKNLKSKKFKNKKPFEFERNSIPSKVDLRGMNVDEALRTVEYYIDKAILANMTNLTIIAGKGTGALKQAVGDYVKKLKLYHQIPYRNNGRRW
ncbi:MAG: Smr/MutS family protein [Candidatus Melainabacteria bacterium]|nr:MAG: Smr/MutS family protein [Candidatus Melainabacteria bacterium]